MNTIKCVVVGDGAVGKTCLLMTYTLNTFPTEYLPTVFDNYTANLMLPEKIGDKSSEKSQHKSTELVTLHLFDTAGQDDYARIRPLSYPQTDIFLVCFSVSERSTFENVYEKWVPEIRQYCPGVPFVLVGNMADLRDDPEAIAYNTLRRNKKKFVTKEEGELMSKRLGAVGYVECSALELFGVKEVFEMAVVGARDSQLKNRKEGGGFFSRCLNIFVNLFSCRSAR